MTERGRNFAVGVTTLVGVAGFVVLLVLFGYVPDLFKSGYMVTVKLNEGGGLQPGGRVTLQGIDVGEVESVRLSRSSNGVVVRTRVREDVDVPMRVHAEVRQSIFGGNSGIALVSEAKPGDPPSGSLAKDDSAVVQGEVLTAGEMFSVPFRTALEGPTAMFGDMSRNFKDLSQQWTQVGSSIDKLLGDPSALAMNVETGTFEPSVAAVLDETRRTLETSRLAMAGVSAVVNDPELRADLKAAAANSRQLTAQADAMVRKYAAVADELAVAVAQVNRLTTAANARKGTVGKLVHDPALYDNLNDTAERMQAVLDEAQLLIEKWKAEGLPVQF